MKKSALDKINIRFRFIRHTCSSMLFEAQENPKVIQQLLGHRDVSTTIKTFDGGSPVFQTFDGQAGR